MLIALNEITINTVLFALHFLTSRIEDFNRISKEISDLCNECDDSVNSIYFSSDKLAYFDRFLKEVMRMCPATSSLITKHTVNGDIKINGLRIPKGEEMVIDILSFHFDQTIWGNHDTSDFFPDRFLSLDENTNNIFPFGNYC